MEVEFYFTINNQCTASWCNIIHIGNTNADTRLPGIWIHGPTDILYIAMSNNAEGGNPYFSVPDFSALPDGEEHILYFKQTATEKILLIDNIQYYDVDGNYLNTNYQFVYPIYLSDPWYVA